MPETQQFPKAQSALEEARGTKKDKEHALTVEKMNNRDGPWLGREHWGFRV